MLQSNDRYPVKSSLTTNLIEDHSLTGTHDSKNKNKTKTKKLQPMSNNHYTKVNSFRESVVITNYDMLPVVVVM
jgi:hypothetical protein